MAIWAIDKFTYCEAHVSTVDPFLKVMTEGLWEVTRPRRVPGMWVGVQTFVFILGNTLSVDLRSSLRTA